MENTGREETPGVDGVDGVGGEGQGDGVGGGWARGGIRTRTRGNLSRFLHGFVEVMWGVKEVGSGVGMIAGETLGAGDRGVGVIRTGIISP